MGVSLNILFVEDSEGDAQMMTRHLERAGFAVSGERVETADGLRAALTRRSWDIVISDDNLPGFSAEGALDVVLEHDPELPFIVISDSIGDDEALRLLRRGAADFVMKDRMARLPILVRREHNLAEARHERLAAQAALAKSEARYRSFFENASIAVVILDPLGRVAEANEVSCRFLGYTHAELLGMTLLQVTYPDDLNLDAELFQELLAGRRQSYEVEKRFFRKGGALAWTSISVSLIRAQDGEPLYYFLICRDITARKQAEKALWESEELNRAIIACAPTAINSTDLQGRVTSWNPACERVFGWKAEEVLGKPLPVIPPEQRGDFERLIDLVVKGEAVRGIEVVGQCKDGSRFTGRLSLAPIFDREGCQIGVLASNEDVSEHKRLEEQLRQSEAQFREIVDGAPMAILIRDETRWLYVNQKMLELFRVERPEDLIERPAIEFIHPRFRALVEERRRLLDDDRAPVGALEEIYVRPDGSEMWVEITGQPIIYGGKPCVLIFMQDISGRKWAEHQITRQMDELRRWQKAMLGREQRSLELKREVNELLLQAGQPERYASAAFEKATNVLPQALESEAEAAFRTMFDSNPLPVLLLKPGSGEIVDANAAACEFFGYTRAELIDCNITDLNALSEAEIKMEIQKAALEKRYYLLFSYRLASGEIRDVEVFGGMIDWQGRRLQFALLNDITGRR